MPLRVRLKCLKGNSPFWAIFVCIIALMFIAVFNGSFFAYYCIYNIGHQEWIAPLCTIGAAVSIVGALMVPAMVKKMEKRYVMAFSAALWLLSSVILAIWPGYTGALVYQIVSGCASAIGLAALWSIVPEAAEYGAWKNGVASPGLVYSICMFALKAVTGFASYGVAAILGLTGFAAALGMNQPESVLNGIRLGIVFVPMAMSILVIISTFFMKKVDRKQMEIIAADLAKRAEASVSE